MGAIVYDDKDGPLIPMGSQSPSDIEISSGLFYLDMHHFLVYLTKTKPI